jgi:hypothetical protein
MIFQIISYQRRWSFKKSCYEEDNHRHFMRHFYRQLCADTARSASTSSFTSRSSYTASSTTSTTTPLIIVNCQLLIVSGWDRAG